MAAEKKHMILNRRLSRCAVPVCGKRLFFSSLLLVTAIVLLLVVCPAASAADVASDQGRGGNPYQALFSKVRQKGAVKLVIQLNVPIGEENGLARSVGSESLTGRIVQAQRSFHDSLSGCAVSGIKEYRNIPYIAMTVDEEALSRLVANPLVSDIAEDLLFRPTLMQSTHLVDADAAWSSGYSGQGWAVVILDTGVDSSHSFLAGKVIAEACFSTNDPAEGAVSLCPNGQETQVGSGAGMNCPDPADECDHGTHVAGIAAGRGGTMSGVARDASIIAIQIFTKFTSQETCHPSSPCLFTYYSDQLRALDYVYDLRNSFNIAAVNLSVGGDDKFTSYCDSHPYAIMKSAIDQLRSAGIAMVIAAGNDNYSDGISAPACISSAVSVGATTKDDQVDDHYSNSASFLSLLAPGTDIISSVPGNDFAMMSGTSMAAPHVAGAWAVLKRFKPSASVDDILSALQRTGVAITDPRNDVTKPRVDVAAALAGLTVDCSSTLSPNLTVFEPVATVNGGPYWIDLRYRGDQPAVVLQVVGFGAIQDDTPVKACAPATVSSSPTVRLRIPDLRIGSVSYWVDLQYIGGGSDILMKVMDYGVN